MLVDCMFKQSTMMNLLWISSGFTPLVGYLTLPSPTDQRLGPGPYYEPTIQAYSIYGQFCHWIVKGTKINQNNSDLADIKEIIIRFTLLTKLAWNNWENQRRSS